MKLYRQPPTPPPPPTRRESRAAQIEQLRYSIRRERQQLTGYRDRYPKHMPEEVAQWARNCEESLAELETELATLSAPRSRSA